MMTQFLRIIFTGKYLFIFEIFGVGANLGAATVYTVAPNHFYDKTGFHSKRTYKVKLKLLLN